MSAAAGERKQSGGQALGPTPLEYGFVGADNDLPLHAGRACEFQATNRADRVKFLDMLTEYADRDRCSAASGRRCAQLAPLSEGRTACLLRLDGIDLRNASNLAADTTC